jgi:glycosyltransferase involved in cell wall biosynthesis
VIASIKKGVFKFIDKFIFLHKDTSGYFEYYGISKYKCIYVPFKANNIDQLSNYQISDHGYLLSCGASYRDYILLANALKRYPCKTVIVLPVAQSACYHHSIIDEALFDDNVRIIRHNFNKDSWYDILSKCRAVALPIRSDSIQCAGISVYLEAMAFGKPVIITEGPATRGLLTGDTAVVCPPNDPIAFSVAIKKVMENNEYRQTLSKNGYTYVKSLGGENRLVKDILNVLITA